MRALIGAALAASLAMPAAAQTRSDQMRFRDLYKELVETNTTLSSGDCTLLAQKIAVHLKAAGFADSDLNVFTIPGHPKQGGIVAILHGTSKTAKPILLLGHLDVVEAKREDWTSDPFTLVEENGYFYGRGTSDDKAMDASWVDALSRYKASRYRPKRDIKMALTCGEETGGAGNGAKWLTENHPDWISAAFALNEGGGGQLDASGKPLMMTVQAAQKFPQSYQFEVTNPGGHSSRPVPDNAIYRLAAGLLKIQAYVFPVMATDITRQYFAKLSPQVGGDMGAAMAIFAKDPADAEAIARLESDPSFNAILHTTCVATLLSAGHASNALPQRADATINCRIFPGTSVEEVRAKLEYLVADPQIKVTATDTRSEVPKGAQPLNPLVFKPAEALVAKMWPGIPVVPSMSAAATDGAFLTPAGIPTYGLSGMFRDPDGNGVHGLNERLRVKSLYDGRDFLYEIVKIYANEE